MYRYNIIIKRYKVYIINYYKIYYKHNIFKLFGFLLYILINISDVYINIYIYKY